MGGVTGVLVAFQRTGDERRLPAAAEHLVGLLRSWGPGPDHLTGLALAGITVPSRLGPRVVDALVFTRSGVVVIAAHEPGAGVWPGPEERAGAGVAAAKGALAAHDGGRYVTGLVAVVSPISEADAGGRLAEPVADAGGRLAEPPAESGGPMAEPVADAGGRLAEPPVDPVAIEPGLGGPEEPVPGPRSTEDPRPEPGSHGEPPDLTAEPDPETLPHPREPESLPGVAVVLADPRGLRRIIGQHNRWRTVWSADDVLDACYALSLAHLAPPRAALLADGFPARIPARSPLPVLPAVVEVPPDPPPPPADDEPGPRIRMTRGQAVFPRQRPIRLVPWGLVFVLTLLVTVGVIAAVFVAQVFHGS
ncbi:hypothetical protein AB0J40_24175 [Amycolatopsis sp. NPDC049691]|uniref:hypothetical protein n=1 Tax=Amycolatopsis sp. NPDC049691 TaxID=3155155 RepID=UPI00343A9AC5